MLYAHDRFISCLGTLKIKSTLFNIFNKMTYDENLTAPNNKLNNKSLQDHIWYHYQKSISWRCRV